MLAALILGLEAALIASQPRSMGVRGGDNKQPPVSSPPWCLGTEAIARQLRGRRNNPTRGCQGCAYCAYSIIITRLVQGHRQPPFFGRGQTAIIGRRAARATGFLFYCRPEEEKYETLIMRRILLYVKLYCALFFTNALSCINSTPLSKLLQPVTMCSTHCSGDAK